MTLTNEQQKNLTQALSLLSTQFRVTFIVEAVPRQRRSDENLQTMPAGPQPETAVQWLARAHDYTAERSGNCFILRKKYTQLDEVPAVTLAECRQALSDMNILMAQFSPNFEAHLVNGRMYHDVGQVYRKFLLSLSPRQKQQMKGAVQGSLIVSPVMKEEALAVADLLPEQKQWLWQMAMHWYVQRPQVPIVATAQEIDNMNRNGAAFISIQPFERKLWGYESKVFGLGAQPDTYYFWTIDEQGFRGSGGWVEGWRLPPTFHVTPTYLKSLGSKRAPTSRTRPDWLKRFHTLPTSPPSASSVTWGKERSVQTIGGVAEYLNHKNDAKKTAFIVDKALAAKPVTLVGEEFITPVEMFRALASLYDLRVVRLPEQPLRLTRKALPRLKELSQLPQAVWNLYPAPLRRVFRIEDIDPEHTAQQAREDEKALARLRESRAELLSPEEQNQRDLLEAKQAGSLPEVSAIGEAMGQYLHKLLKPRTGSAADGVVLLSEMYPEEEAAFACYLMALTRRDCRGFTATELPSYIEKFSQFHISGALGVGGKPEQFSITFAAPNPGGEMVGGGGPMFNGTLEPAYPGDLRQKP